MSEYKEKWYTVREAVEKTRISQATIQNNIKKGNLKASEITDSSARGFHYMIAEADLNKWLSSRKADVISPMTHDDIAAVIKKMVDDAYNRGFEDGKIEARKAVSDVLKGMK